jgi:type IV secretory pathway TraG/TraD family ATPase VirD4
VLREFWLNEFEKMNEKLRTDAIAPVLNKVGQFLSSQRIRHIVGTQRSTLSLEEVMSQGKILILNLSQGKLGEDTTALLGAMFITKIQLAAMKRVSLPNEQRKDFYLYVDEFQNFATGSFTKILSEARKYRLDLILANQYIGQVAEEVQRAIFGNVGTLATFVVGAGDAAALAKELGGTYTEEDLVNLGKYEILIKMAINGLTSTPFAATTLPLPSVVNGNRDKIIRLSLEKYYRKVV